MKNIAIASALVMLFAATASAGDLAVSNATLEGMGLGSMERMSDEAGMEVRGMGLLDSLFGGGTFGIPADMLGDGVGIPEEFQLGNAIGIALNDGFGDLDLPDGVGLPTDILNGIDLGGIGLDGFDLGGLGGIGLGL